MALRDEIIYQAAKRALFAHALVEKWSIRGGRFLSGFALGALSNEQLSRLTTEAYNRRGTYARTDIFDWEREWFEQDLPPPPARILVGGAGSGREVRYLISKGYRVVAFDPAENYVKNELKNGLPEGWEAFYVGSYEDLSGDRTIENPNLWADLKAHEAYDAIVLGWGSLTHIPDEDVRVRLFQVLGQLSSGPVLASFWSRLEGRDDYSFSRPFQLGKGLARISRRRRSQEQGDRVIGRAGFIHAFSKQELHDFANRCGYRIGDGWKAAPYPHATFLSAESVSNKASHTENPESFLEVRT
jgi:hypothetical protein